MKTKSVFKNFIEDIEKRVIIPTTQKNLRKLNPRSLIPKVKFSRLGYRSSLNEGVNYFYEIDNDGNVAFYLICHKEKSLDWILEDLVYKVLMDESNVHFELSVGTKSILFTFPLNSVDSIYSAISIGKQSSIMMYYLMEQEDYYMYLGYNQLDICNKTKDNIVKYIEAYLVK